MLCSSLDHEVLYSSLASPFAGGIPQISSHSGGGCILHGHRLWYLHRYRPIAQRTDVNATSASIAFHFTLNSAVFRTVIHWIVIAATASVFPLRLLCLQSIALSGWRYANHCSPALMRLHARSAVCCWVCRLWSACMHQLTPQSAAGAYRRTLIYSVCMAQHAFTPGGSNVNYPGAISTAVSRIHIPAATCCCVVTNVKRDIYIQSINQNNLSRRQLDTCLLYTSPSPRD